LLVSGSLDRSIRIWDLTRRETNNEDESSMMGTCVKLLNGHDGSITALQINDTHVVSGAEDRTLRIWSMNGKCMKRINMSAPPSCINLSPQHILSGSQFPPPFVLLLS
jgi:mitochondrial division protein 1